jgi:hypothetical protein
MRRYLAPIAAAALFTLVTASIASAASKVRCPRETEAEQAIHLEMRLMVASSICTNTAYDDLLKHASPALTSYMGEARRRHPGFDSYVTKLANLEGQVAGHQTVTEYCKASAELFDAIQKIATSDDFRHYMDEQVALHRNDPPTCAK